MKEPCTITDNHKTSIHFMSQTIATHRLDIGTYWMMVIKVEKKKKTFWREGKEHHVFYVHFLDDKAIERIGEFVCTDCEGDHQNEFIQNRKQYFKVTYKSQYGDEIVPIPKSEYDFDHGVNNGNGAQHAPHPSSNGEHFNAAGTSYNFALSYAKDLVVALIGVGDIHSMEDALEKIDSAAYDIHETMKAMKDGQRKVKLNF